MLKTSDTYVEASQKKVQPQYFIAGTARVAVYSL